MIAELEQRLVELEIRFSHQSRQLEELNDVVTDCYRRIDRLREENKSLRSMLGRLEPLLEESPDE